MKRAIGLILLLLTFYCLGIPQTVSTDQVTLTTPEAPWTVVMEGKAVDIKTVQIKPDGKSGYFLIYPDKDELNVSLFIEPAEKCKSSDECRDFILNAGNPAWGKFQDLAKSKAGDFSYFEFFRPVAMGQPLKMFDMYAQYVGNGYWVDLHVSKTLYKAEDHALFERLVKSVKFIPKGSEQSINSEKSIDTVRKVTESWLALWGSRKCRESYQALTSISREAVTEKQWMEYCSAASAALGKFQSRKLVATTLMKSLPPKPDRSGATLRYQSTFENGQVIEFVSLTTEKDGTWTVSNYATQ